MIDTHAHLLPGIDDGAASLEETLLLARGALAAGVKEVVCTPHLSHTSLDTVTRAPDRLGTTTAALRDAGLHLDLHLGYEMTFSFAAGLEADELKAYSLAGTGKAVLVEMPYQGWPPHAEEAVFGWRLKGLVPVLAHPERNPRVQRDWRVVERLVELGAVVQGTAPSLLGLFGSGPRRCLLRLLSEGLVSLMASDAHGRRADYDGFAKALAELARRAPSLDVGALTGENPRRLLAGEPLLPLAPVATGRRRLLPWNGRGGN